MMYLNRQLAQWGKKLSFMASNLLLLASSDGVGAAIQKQWIKDLRNIANEMETYHGSESSSETN